MGKRTAKIQKMGRASAFLCVPPPCGNSLGAMSCQYASYYKESLYNSTCRGTSTLIYSIRWYGTTFSCQPPYSYFLRQYEYSSRPLYVGVNDCNATSYLCQPPNCNTVPTSFSQCYNSNFMISVNRGSSTCWGTPYQIWNISAVSPKVNQTCALSPNSFFQDIDSPTATYYMGVGLCSSQMQTQPSVGYMCETDSCYTSDNFNLQCNYSVYNMSTAYVYSSCWQNGYVATDLATVPGALTQTCRVSYGSSNIRFDVQSGKYYFSTGICNVPKMDPLVIEGFEYFGYALVALYGVVILTTMYMRWSLRKSIVPQPSSVSDLKRMYEKYKNSPMILYPTIVYPMYVALRTFSIGIKYNGPVEEYIISLYIMLVNVGLFFELTRVMIFYVRRRSFDWGTERPRIEFAQDIASLLTILYLVPYFRCSEGAYNDDFADDDQVELCQGSMTAFWLSAVVNALFGLSISAVFWYLGISPRFRNVFLLFAIPLTVIACFVLMPPFLLMVDIPSYVFGLPFQTLPSLTRALSWARTEYANFGAKTSTANLLEQSSMQQGQQNEAAHPIDDGTTRFSGSTAAAPSGVEMSSIAGSQEGVNPLAVTRV